MVQAEQMNGITMDVEELEIVPGAGEQLAAEIEEFLAGVEEIDTKLGDFEEELDHTPMAKSHGSKEAGTRYKS